MTHSTAIPQFAKVYAALLPSIALATIGCVGDIPSPSPTLSPSRADLEQVTTTAGLGSVATDGSFILAIDQGQDEINQSEAKALASAYAQQLLPYLQTYLEATRGAPIERKQLRACGRAFYAESPFETVPTSVPRGIRQGHGPYWLVTLCAGVEPQVSVAVSALAQGVRIREGRLIFPKDGGGEFFAFGVPRGHGGEFPISPEMAALIAGEETGAKLTGPPRLVLPIHSEGIPQNAKWEIHLDRPSKFVGVQRGRFESDQTAIGVVLDGRGSERIEHFGPAALQQKEVRYSFVQPIALGSALHIRAIGEIGSVVATARAKPGRILNYEISRSEASR